jgi:hypothetical protein
MPVESSAATGILKQCHLLHTRTDEDDGMSVLPLNANEITGKRFQQFRVVFGSCLEHRRVGSVRSKILVSHRRFDSCAKPREISAEAVHAIRYVVAVSRCWTEENPQRSHYPRDAFHATSQYT